MAVDLVLSKASVAASTGVLTLTTQIFMNPVLVATYSAVNVGAAVPTVTVDTAHSRINVVLAITPNSPVASAAAETGKTFGDLTYPNAGVTGI